MSETVAAIVVTFNRKQLLMECLDALLAQTRPINKILLVDNASTDGTPDILEEHGYLSNTVIEYIRLPENTGGAGGFYEGVKRGYEAGYDWLWLMDDDAEPLPDALEKMAMAFNVDNVAAVTNVVVDAAGTPDLNHRGWSDICSMDWKVIRLISTADLNKVTSEIKQASFVGLAIRRAVVGQIGYPRKEFFIHFDDYEYCDRISAAGKIILVSASIIKHKEARKEHAENISLFGKRSDRVLIEKLWLSYYGQRNRIWLKRQHCSSALWYALKSYARTCVGIILYDDYKIFRMRFYLNAILDGWLGRFDNAKPKNITRWVQKRNS